MFVKQDNRYKWQIRSALIQHLYLAFDKAQQEILASIIERNCQLLQAKALSTNPNNLPKSAYHRSFGFNGSFYNLEFDSGPVPHNRLHPSLVGEMQDYEALQQQVKQFERVVVEGYLTSVLSISNSPGDWHALLPPMMGDILKDKVLNHVTLDWTPTLTPEKMQAFVLQRQKAYDTIRGRLAANMLM